MNLLAPISDIMTKDLITVGPEDNIKKVENIFLREKIHHLPVIDEGLLVGMVSQSDYLFFKRGFSADETPDNELDLLRLKTKKVKDIMTTGLAKLEPTDRIQAAVEVFKENMFHAIPIVNGKHLRGIVTTFDLINHLAKDIKS